MFNNKKFIAVILARGGSKRLPGKNLLPLQGKPLLQYTIEAALASKYIDNVSVSSDSEEILNLAKKLHANTIKRPEELANDTATSYDAVKHALENNSDYDYVILLQPTSPLRDSEDIDNAISFLINKNADAVVSVCEMDHNPLWANTLPKNYNMSNFLKKELINKRTQDLEKYYRLNGAIYICKKENFLQEGTFFIQNNIFAFEMSTISSVDIDTKLDFLLAETILKDKNE